MLNSSNVTAGPWLALVIDESAPIRLNPVQEDAGRGAEQRMTVSMRLLLLAFVALLLAGCSVSSGSRNYSRGPDRAQTHETVPYVAFGSNYERALGQRDAYQISGAFLSAMASEPNTSMNWSARRTGAHGMVIAGDAYLRDVDFARGRRLNAPIGLYTDHPLEPTQGDYEVKQNTNVRLGPNTNSPIVNTLTEGTVLEAAGRVRGQQWLLMARGGAVIGYMYEPLLEQRDGGDLLLAGGTSRTPTYCRDYRQTLRLPGGIDDSWSGTACRDRQGRWYIEGAPQLGF